MAKNLHCIAKKHDSYWSARCLDFSLYAVGDTLDEAKQKLNAEIDEYLYDALEGESKNYAPYLLLRKADLSEWVLFYTLELFTRFHSLRQSVGEAFSLAIPHGPYTHGHA